MEVLIIGIIVGSLLIFSPAKKAEQAQEPNPKPTSTTATKTNQGNSP